jgi:hypothetical protein
MKKSPLRVLAAACIVAAGFCFVATVFVVGLNNKSAAERDFISYWAAGQQLMHGANPYDFEAVRNLERSAGREDREALLVMRNPPVALFVAAPLGLVSPKSGLVLWLLVLLAGLSISIFVIWILNGRPDNRLHLLGYFFAPAIACLMAGQFGIFLLLGVVFFLYFHQSRPFLAGAALLLCALKPHMFLPFAVVLLVWAVYRKAYLILAGFSAALLASCAFSFFLDANAWPQYSQMMRTGGALNEPVPTLAVTLRFLVNRDAVWLQFLPAVAGCCWALWYYWTRRNRWNWLEEGMVLLLVSAMCAPFGWFTDESLLLPAVLAGVYRAVSARRSLLPLGLISVVALIEVFREVDLTSRYYLWSTPAWLGWYLYATRKSGTDPLSSALHWQFRRHRIPADDRQE